MSYFFIRNLAQALDLKQVGLIITNLYADLYGIHKKLNASFLLINWLSFEYSSFNSG